MTTQLPKAPVTNAEVDEEWCAMVRAVIAVGLWQLRASPITPTIEARRRADSCKFDASHWMPVAMKSGSTMFVNATERDLVLARLLKT